MIMPCFTDSPDNHGVNPAIVLHGISIAILSTFMIEVSSSALQISLVTVFLCRYC